MAADLNTLHYRDNPDVPRRHVADESGDLVYLDAPFKSNAYNVLFWEHAEKSAAHRSDRRAIDQSLVRGPRSPSATHVGAEPRRGRRMAVRRVVANPPRG